MYFRSSRVFTYMHIAPWELGAVMCYVSFKSSKKYTRIVSMECADVLKKKKKTEPDKLIARN